MVAVLSFVLIKGPAYILICAARPREIGKWTVMLKT